MVYKIAVIFAVTLLFGCGDKKKETTPKTEPKEVVDMSDTGSDKAVPADQEEAVVAVWNSGLSAVKNCISVEIKKTQQKGIDGYIILSARIGVSEKPQDLKVIKTTLKVKNINSCIIEYLKDLEFPTWGYAVKYQHPYSINILY